VVDHSGYEKFHNSLLVIRTCSSNHEYNVGSEHKFGMSTSNDGWVPRVVGIAPALSGCISCLSLGTFSSKRSPILVRLG